jgi:hypothetical protein
MPDFTIHASHQRGGKHRLICKQKLKRPISEAPILLLRQNIEVGATHLFFGLEAELLKLKMFDRPFLKLS